MVSEVLKKKKEKKKREKGRGEEICALGTKEEEKGAERGGEIWRKEEKEKGPVEGR